MWTGINKSGYKQPAKWLFQIPVLGALAFLGLYFLAAIFYPGGSEADRRSIGFSLLHNYWCNLLNVVALNGELNRGRVFAVAAMFVLGFTLFVFWYLVTQILPFSRQGKLVLTGCGLGSALAVLLLPFGSHDITLNIAGLLGLSALVMTLFMLRRLKETGLAVFGWLNLILVLLNNVVYYTSALLRFLPMVQKVTFLAFILWIVYMTSQFNRLLDKQQGNNPPGVGKRPMKY